MKQNKSNLVRQIKLNWIEWTIKIEQAKAKSDQMIHD